MKTASTQKPADLLLLNGTVLTLNERAERFEPGGVAIRDSTVQAVGPAADMAAAYTAAKTIDTTGCVIMPGLINSHTHAAMTLFRGLADDLPLMDWLQQHIFPAETKLNEHAVFCGTQLACAEMILSGTTCFCDMYLFENQVAEAAKAAGMRCLVGEGVFDFPSPSYGHADNAIAFTEDLIDRWAGDPLVRIAVMPHSLYTVSPGLLKKCRTLAANKGVPLCTHLSETESEVADILRRYGKRPVQHAAGLGLLSDRLIAAHCVVLDEADMKRLAENGVHAVNNPESNMKLASGISPVSDLLRRGINVCLGTDGTASNNDLDMFAEMDTCAKLHKVGHLSPTAMPAPVVLRLATRNGAKALGLAGRIGEITPGGLADVIVVDFDQPHLTPVYDPISHLVYAVTGTDVIHSIIHGRLVMENRQLLTIDVRETMAKVRKLAETFRVHACHPAGG